MTMKQWFGATLLLGAGCASAATDTITVSDIRVEGLQRVALGATLTHVPFNVGDEVSRYTLSQTIREMYHTGHFDDVKVYLDDGIVLFEVIERPTISAIEFDGNKDIKEEQLQESLNNNGVKVGEPLDRTILSNIENGLLSFFHSVGKYNASVNAQVVKLSRNRVKLKFTFEEGKAASVKQINIVGNKVFSDDDLYRHFESQQDLPWWRFLSSDRYQSETLKGDLERVKSHYLDHGYLRYKVDSNQVSVTPERDSVYITLNVDEGEQYKVTKVDFSGELAGLEDFLENNSPIVSGELYNGSIVTQTEEMIKTYLSNQGYAYPKVETIPAIDDAKKEVALTVHVQPGKRIYVRRISFEGNHTTKDEVIRREIRQMEGAWMSEQQLNLSKTLIQRLSYIERVDYKVEKVPGEDDLVDVIFSVKEQPSGQFEAGISYGSYNKLAFQFGMSQNNFMGTGDVVSLRLNTSSYSKNISLSYTDPYYTIDGVSLGGNVYYRDFDAGRASLSRYKSKAYGVSTTAGFPMDDNNRISVGIGYNRNQLSSISIYDQIEQFINQFNETGEGLDFETFELNTGWTRNTLNRGRFPTEGTYNSVNMKVSTPNSDLKFYKLTSSHRFYYPLSNDHQWTFLAKLNLGYGNGYGDIGGVDQDLPFWENFYSGQKVRGFESNTIGPRALQSMYTQVTGTPNKDGTFTTTRGNQVESVFVSNSLVGGNAMAVGGLELIFPTPFISDDYRNAVRTSFFVDVGNVWDTEFNIDAYKDVPQSGTHDLADYSDPTRIRSSVGLSLQWISPMAPMTFSFSRQLKRQPEDRTEFFSFTIGARF